MNQLLNDKWTFRLYRYRFLAVYTFYGFLSLLVELLASKFLHWLGLSTTLSTIFGLGLGILVAFVLNVHFNFQVPKSKQKKALVYFSVISILAFSIQYFIRSFIVQWQISMELSRFIVAGLLFLFSYYLHRRFSFREYKKVGVAIYANEDENIEMIYEKIAHSCDYIHLDIVDETIKSDCAPTKASRAATVRRYWGDKPIEAHIMSKKPSQWFADILPFVNTVYVHASVDEPLQELLAKINAAGCKSGIAISLDEDLNTINPFVDVVDSVLLLAIKNPGISGQIFNDEIYARLDLLNQHAARQRFSVCVDGGVNHSNIKNLSAEKVVSGSFVLQSSDPKRKIMNLQTSGAYEAE
jgi:ribulose-phosphate 3-epimerase